MAAGRRGSYAEATVHPPSPPIRLIFIVALAALGACASLPNRDPLVVSVAGIEPLPSEGMELNLAVRIRVQNPNDTPVQYTGIALALDVNGRHLASGVSDSIGAVPRYGQSVFTVPVTVSAFDAARQVFGFLSAQRTNELSYRVRGKLEGGLFGTRRFREEGTFTLATPTRAPD